MPGILAAMEPMQHRERFHQDLDIADAAPTARSRSVALGSGYCQWVVAR